MREKLVTLDEAAALIPSGVRLGLGGLMFRRHPMALIRRLAARNVRNLTLQTWVGGIDVDLLIGAGCVSRVEAAYVGLGPMGLAPNFRRGVETGQVEVEDFSESAMIGRFRAAASGLTFLPTPALLGTDMARRGSQTAPITCPFTGRPYVAVAAARPDVAVFHAYWSDVYGNVQAPLDRNKDDIDVTIAKAAERVIVTVERVVSHGEIIRNKTLTLFPHHWVDAVVEVPWGAHPGDCDTYYEADFPHLERYLEAARDPEAFQAYLRDYVFEPPDHWSYVDKVGGLGRLTELARPARRG